MAPHQHLAVTSAAHFGSGLQQLPTLMAAVETLGRMGWDLVTFSQLGDRTLTAVLRRQRD